MSETRPTGGRPEDWKESGRRAVRSWLDPVVRGLVRLGVTANLLTLGGLVLAGVGGYWFARGHFTTGALWAIAGSLADAMDGAVARARGEVTAFGAFLDSVVDRVSDTLLFLGVALYYFFLPVETGRTVSGVLISQSRGEDLVNYWLTGASALVALAGSYMVSYTRARAEGLGTDCKVGWFERPERLIVLLGAALFGPAVMEYALLLLAAMTWFTVVQRVLHVRRRLGPAPLHPRG